MVKIRNYLASALFLVSGCAAIEAEYRINQQASQNPRGNLEYFQSQQQAPVYVQQPEPFQPAFNPSLNTTYTNFAYNRPDAGTPEALARERQMWYENSQVPGFFPGNCRVQQHILDETRGANFMNPNDAAAAHQRALQIKEQAWYNFVQQRNQQLESQGYHRSRRN